MGIILSIVIPVYNVETCLGRCLDSIIKSVAGASVIEAGYDPVEVIAVDDGSSDGSLAVLDEYASKIDYITVIHQDNEGPAAARNAGLMKAAGEWVWFVDPDDYVDEDAISAILEETVSKNDSAPDVIIFDAYEHEGITQPEGTLCRCKSATGIKIPAWEHFKESSVFATPEDIQVLQKAVLYPYEIRATKRIVPMAAPWDKVYRKSFLDKNGLKFNPELRVLDDMFFNMEVFGQAKKVAYVKKSIYHYVRNPESITSSYTPGRAGKDIIVWKAVEAYIVNHPELRQAYFKRVVRSFAICCKRSIFHPMNPDGKAEKLAELRRILSLPEYERAFSGVEISELEWRLKPIAWLGKRESVKMIKVLCDIERLMSHK